MRYRALFCTFVCMLLGGTVLYLLWTSCCVCRPATPLPSQVQLCSYLEKVDKTHVPALIATLRGVQDAEGALQALPVFFRLGRSMREDYERLRNDSVKGFETTPTQYSLADLARLYHRCASLFVVENEHYHEQSELYATLKREVERLRAANFFGVPTLGSLLRLYVVDEVKGEPLLLWYPGSQLREAAARREKGKSLYTTEPGWWTIHSIYREKEYVSYGREQHMDLLFLDLCHRAGLRSHEDILFYPYSPLIRNRTLTPGRAYFVDCMCAGFCLAETPAPPQPGSKLPLAYRHPLSLLSMSGEQLRLLPEYDCCIRRGKYLQYVLKLQPPFNSKYLYIHTDERGQSDALHFISEEQDRERRKADAESGRQD